MSLTSTPAMTVTKTSYNSTGKITFVLHAGSAVAVIFITKVDGTTPVAGRIDAATPPKAFLQVSPDEFNYLRGFVSQTSVFTIQLGYDTVSHEVVQLTCETMLVTFAPTQ